MKKLFTLALISFALLQSCKIEDAEIAPEISGIPAGVSIESAVKSMEGFVLEDFKALLLKPVDNDPQTNLTTLFIADAKGKIWPVIENFEVKDVRVTSNGIYVLTNYFKSYSDPNNPSPYDQRDPIAFFVKYDHTWLQLKDVGVFRGEDDNNNLVFQSGAILNPQTLQVERLYVKEYNNVGAVSGNVNFVTKHNGRGIPVGAKVRNHIIHTEYPLDDHFTFPGVASFKGTDFALIPAQTGSFSQTLFIDMKTGKRTAQEAIPGFLLSADIIRLDDGSIVGIEGIRSSSFPPKIGLVQLSVKQNNNGEIIPDRILHSSVSVTPNFTSLISKGYLFGSDKYYLFREADQVKVFDKSLIHKGDILSGLSNLTLSLVDALVYYSGIENGKPVSGVYNLETNQNTVLDNKDVFSNIQPL